MKTGIVSLDEEMKQLNKTLKGHKFISKENEHCYYDVGSVGGYGAAPVIYGEKEGSEGSNKRVRTIYIPVN